MNKKEKDKSLAAYMGAILVGTLSYLGTFFPIIITTESLLFSLVGAGIVGSATSYVYGLALLRAMLNKKTSDIQTKVKGGKR